MTPHQVVAVAVRLFAAWLLIAVFRNAASFAFLPRSEVPGFWVAATFLALAVLLVGILWFFPLSIARKVLSQESAKAEASATPDMWLAMGCALIGLWLLTSALPSLVFNTYAPIYSNSSSSDESLGRLVVYYAAEVGIGLWLVFGAKGFRQLFWWARNAGVKKAL